MATEPTRDGASDGGSNATACTNNTDVEIWRVGAPTLTRADIDALIEAADEPRGALEATIEKLQIIRSGDYYADKIFVTAHGGIGIDCGGTVITMPLREWHKLAAERTKRE